MRTRDRPQDSAGSECEYLPPRYHACLPNDLPFSSERQVRVRAYHGREEPRAQPAVSRHRQRSSGQRAFGCCNGGLDRATSIFGSPPKVPVSVTRDQLRRLGTPALFEDGTWVSLIGERAPPPAAERAAGVPRNFSAGHHPTAGRESGLQPTFGSGPSATRPPPSGPQVPTNLGRCSGADLRLDDRNAHQAHRRRKRRPRTPLSNQ
jgi:hypothetical protein